MDANALNKCALQSPRAGLVLGSFLFFAGFQLACFGVFNYLFYGADPLTTEAIQRLENKKSL
jgi:hypothetical protein